MSGIVGSAIGSGIGGIAGAAVNWFLQRFAIRDANKAGRTEQAKADLQAADDKVKEAKDVQADIAAAGDDQRDQLRRKWTRPAGGG
jgi:cellobiose-specific phosphotransferase system component IIA